MFYPEARNQMKWAVKHHMVNNKTDLKAYIEELEWVYGYCVGQMYAMAQYSNGYNQLCENRLDKIMQEGIKNFLIQMKEAQS
jgi:hypothetical protein